MTEEPTGSMAVQEPIGEDGAGVRCRRCGTETPAGANQCAACGSFVAGNDAAKVHGLYAYRAGSLPPDLRVSLEEFRGAIISDQGGLDKLTAVRAGLCRLLVDAEAGRRLLMNVVIERGIDSKPGRAAYDRLLGTMDRWLRIAGALGLERRAKDVTPKSPTEALMREPELS